MTALFIILNLHARREREARRDVRLLRRQLRDDNPFAAITDEDFVKLYRFPKTLCKNLIDELSPFLKTSHMHHAIPTFIKVLSALRFFASGGFQRTVGEDTVSSLSQASVSRSVTEITIALHKIAHHHVQFPKREEFAALKSDFEQKFKFPGVVGVIDGTHVKIAAPRRDLDHVYSCPTGGHSKNILIICDANNIVLSASARFGGAAKDEYVWQCSRARQILEELHNNGERNFWLVGDNGYPLQPWLMTPIATPNNPAEVRYNSAHKSTRSVAATCVNLLKSRFRCLSAERPLFYNPPKAGLIINACIVLHNILVRSGVLFDDFLDLEDASEESIANEEALAAAVNDVPSCKTQRANLVRKAFSK